ncbi:MAG: hypothetical protein A2W25_10720 [candidate division Zixibacteria bacterium RBG_16_53_22]|nr:MAG: hypothetical protein A2W25_10720 [candidate division Zixibacteria bacterium RBG_16_53_22]
MADTQTSYPVKLSIDFPDRPLNRLSSFFRLFAAIPIMIIILLLYNAYLQYPADSENGCAPLSAAIYTGYVILPALLMILFRRKYPRWWFDWNLNLARFATRVSAYICLLRDEYPSTDDEQTIHLEIPYPNAAVDLNRWLPLVKWLLAIPHYIVLVFLVVAAVVVVIIAWFAILFTGRYPRSLFNFVVGVFRWAWRVSAYCALLVTDKYPPFRLAD